MPRYFFDTDDGDWPHLDDHGQVLRDAGAARLMAVDTLPDLAREKRPDGDQGEFSVRVRDEAGTVIYSASLSLLGEWHITPPAS